VFFLSPDPLLRGNLPEECLLGPVEEKTGKNSYISNLYVRENGNTTVDISKPPAGVPDYGASFVGATPDGSRVFFVTRSQLTPDKANSDPDLYEYDVETGALKRLSVGPPGYDDADLAGPPSASEDPANWAMVSSDGSHVYFTGMGQLVPGAGASAATNKANETVNLYVYANGSVSFIAIVTHGNFNGDSGYSAATVAPLNVDVGEVTPDGSDLVFDSDSQLTAYDNAGRAELYRYDAPSHTISCVSCSPAFAPPNGPLDPVFHTSFWDNPHGTVQQFGGLSNDGDTVFFASTDQLLPAAANVLAAEPGNPIYDIYEWHDGVLSLISSGTSVSSDFLLGASPSGSDVFFLSASQLVPQDGEHAYQIYDARTEGGFAAPATPAPCASAATCRSMVASPPTTITPATVSVSGPGDVTTVTGSESQPPAKPKVESRSEKLAKALKACKKDKSKKKRVTCEKLARKKYGPLAKKKTKKT
ncbi:MAG TPA: hypothetical protein VN786_06720, partial [Acidimicrobiales bacterium]|nr:hypothetical protein [Acidimicrobiales bacterium]